MRSVLTSRPRRTGRDEPMIRSVMTGLLVAAWMAPAHADEKSQPKIPPAKENETVCECSSGKDPATARRVFELRTYYLNDGKLTDLHKRFRDHTCQLLKKHGAE